LTQLVVADLQAEGLEHLALQRGRCRAGGRASGRRRAPGRAPLYPVALPPMNA
jgi:hypothetical protein